MSKWLRSSIYLTIVLAIIICLLPFILGLLAENRCKKIVGFINTATPLSAKIINYKRGWFSAKAKAQISLDKLNLKNKELYQLQIIIDIDHGPMTIDWARFHFVQATIDAKIRLNALQNERLQRSDNTPIATANVKFKLNGNTDIKINSTPLNYQEKNDTLGWQGLTIKALFSPLYSKIKSSFNFAGIDIKKKDLKFHLGEVISTHQGNKSSSGLWLGKRNLQVESLINQSASNRIIAIKKAMINNTIEETPKNLININTSATIESLNINKHLYTQNKIICELSNLQQKTLYNLLQQYVINQTLTSPTNFGFDTIISILNNGGKIKIKELNTTTPWGKLFANAEVTFPNQPNNTGLLSTIADTTININIKTKQPLVLHLLEKFYRNTPLVKKEGDPAQQAAKLLEEWKQSEKVFINNNDGYLNINFSYQNNQLLINNKPLTIALKL